MDGTPLKKEDLLTLLEAARWAPSSGNGQPWRFVYGLQGTPAFTGLFDLLAAGNRPWCSRAGALLVVLSKSTRDKGDRARTHSFDTGAAWMSIALQATQMNLVAHGMEGFDYDRARSALSLSDEMTVECMVALGHQGKSEDLPEPYRSREQPSTRRPIVELVTELVPTK